MESISRYDLLTGMAEEALASINVLFAEPDAEGGLAVADISGREWVHGLQKTFLAIKSDLETLRTNPESAARLYRTFDTGRADSVDMMNSLVQLSCGREFAVNLDNAFRNIFVCRGIAGRQIADLSSPVAVDARFYFLHAVRLVKNMMLLRQYPEMLKSFAGEEKGLSRLCPAFYRLAAGNSVFTAGRDESDPFAGMPLQKIAEELEQHDPFRSDRAFRFINGNFQRVDVSKIRKAEDFFGYSGVKHSFSEHFARFAGGIAGEPLLVSGLPGLGKTQFTMAHALATENLILVLAGPDELENGLEVLLGKLKKSGEHRFVVFFDDIDPRTLDWYWFRTNVGGALAMPENVMIVLAANYDFPASILSRGRGITFPVFDVVRCEEMVEDFLKSKGLRNPSPELVGVIAADYTEEFGQKKFPELSPRTLIRYLGWYDKDLNKRRRLLEQSKLELVSRPDSQLFQEFNLKQIKLLYGSEKVLETVGEGLNG